MLFLSLCQEPMQKFWDASNNRRTEDKDSQSAHIWQVRVYKKLLSDIDFQFM